MAIIYTYPIKTTSANRNDLILISDSADKNKTKQISVAKLPGGIDFVGVGGNGTAGKIPKWSTQYDLTDSSISEDSVTGNIGIGIQSNGSALATLDVSKNGLDTDQPIIRITQRKDDTSWPIAEMGRFEFFSSDGSGNSPYNLGYVGISNDYVGGTLPSGAMTFATTPYNATGGSEAAIERMRISSSGSVGIGTTSPAVRLHVQDGKIRVNGGGANQIQLHRNPSTQSNYIEYYDTVATSQEAFVGYTSNNKDFKIYNAGASGTISFLTNSGTAMSITNSRNVGIGTTITDSILTVKANPENVSLPVIKASVSGFANGYTLIGDNYTAGESQINLGISYSGANGVLSRSVKVSNTTDDVFLSSQDNYATNPNAFVLDRDGSFRFLNTSTTASTPVGTAVSLVERMRINSSGNVGIGTISPAADGLEVANRAAVSGGNTQLFITGNTTGRSVLGLGDGANRFVQHIVSDHTQNSISFHTLATSVTNNERMRIASNGNVGIGQTNPNAQLDIKDTASQTAIRVINDTYNNYLLQKTRSDNTQILGIQEFGSNGGLSLVTGGFQRLNINNLGNVGIGTTAHTSKLAVDGGDIEVDDSASGLILRSPDNARYRITVTNLGALSVTAI